MAELLPYKIRKKQFLLQPGEVCQYQAFVVQGALRLYTVDARGNKHIHVLGVENMWIGDRESWSQLTPSPYYIEAVEDAQLLLINCPQAQALVRTVPLVAELVRIQDERNAIATQRRLHDAISCSAEERYAAFIAQHPTYVQRRAADVQHGRERRGARAQPRGRKLVGRRPGKLRVAHALALLRGGPGRCQRAANNACAVTGTTPHRASHGRADAGSRPSPHYCHSEAPGGRYIQHSRGTLRGLFGAAPQL
nr:hypothetical protein [Tanacetum cinerariifolium]